MPMNIAVSKQMKRRISKLSSSERECEVGRSAFCCEETSSFYGVSKGRVVTDLNGNCRCA
jgi:hypothetical protein